MRPRYLQLIVRPSFLALALGGCPEPETNDTGTTDTGIDPTGSTGITTGATTMGPPADSSSGGGSGAGSSGGTTSGTTGGSSGTGSSSGDTGNDDAGVIPRAETPCGGVVYECGDLIDNDGDGFFDLFDTECTGPCDDDEGSFQTGLPGDNVDCIQDCFFDGNSGQGEGCFWDLTCDPANPGADINCEYMESMSCQNLPHDPVECAASCEPLVPPGCDCAGCCTVELPDGTTIDIFLNSHPDCSLDNLEACQQCTSQAEECGNPCNPEMCELCFGQDESELPPECEDNVCDNGMPCDVNEDCPATYFCLSDCCYPPPPG